MRTRMTRAVRSTGLSGTGVELEGLEARRMLTAVDLMLEVNDSFSPLDQYLPGDTIVVPFAVRNNGADAFTGRFRAVVTARRQDGNGDFVPEGPTFSFTGSLTGLAPDASQFFEARRLVTTEYRPGDYVFDVDMTPLTTQGAEIEDEYDGDNMESTEHNGPVEFKWRFGTFDDRVNTSIQLIDADGTRFSIKLSGLAYADVLLTNDNLNDPQYQVNVTTTSPLPVSIVWKTLAKTRPSANAFIDFRGDFAFESDSNDYGSGVMSFTGPALNFNGSATIPAKPSELSGGATALLNAFPELKARWEALRLQGTTVRLNNLSGEFTVDGNSTSFKANDLTDASLRIDGTCTLLRVRDMARSTISVSGALNTFATRNLLSSEVVLDRTAATVTMGNLSLSEVSVNAGGLPMRTTMDATLGSLFNSRMYADVQVNRFSVQAWANTNPDGPQRSALTLRAVNTFTCAGDFDADLFVIGGISRPTQLGSATISGTMYGSIFVGGSAGSVTIQTLNSGTHAQQMARRGRFVPSLVVSGTLANLTARSVISGAAWVAHAGTISVNASVSNAWFELAGGARIKRQDLVDGDVRAAIDSVRWGSGVVNAFTATKNAGVTGFVFRAVSGVDLTSDESTVQRLSGFSGALDLSQGYTLVSAMTRSRVNSFSLTSRSQDNLQLAFMQLPRTFVVGGLSLPIAAAPATGPDSVVDVLGSTSYTGVVFRPARPA